MMGRIRFFGYFFSVLVRGSINIGSLPGQRNCKLRKPFLHGKPTFFQTMGSQGAAAL